MELTILDEDFKALGIMDTFESVIWTDRYSTAGDFDITTYAMTSIVNYLTLGRYLELKESNKTMIIEDYWIHTDYEIGNTVLIKGRSLESLLSRRILWGQKNITGNLQDSIEDLLNENVINPTDTDRIIPGLIFEASTDPNVTSIEVDAQFTGENLYNAIRDLCLATDIGFEIVRSSTNQLVFKLYSGVDRSYDQILVPYVIFSPEFDNLSTSDYKATDTYMKTVALVAGEGEGIDQKTATAESVYGSGTGLSRREMYVSATDISSNVEGGTLTLEEYTALLVQRGKEELAKNIFSETFEGQLLSTNTFIYGEHFLLGDIVQVESEYGHEGKARVVEIIHVQDSTGQTTYPTFITV